jgi:hypothetical protein
VSSLAFTDNPCRGSCLHGPALHSSQNQVKEREA